MSLDNCQHDFKTNVTVMLWMRYANFEKVRLKEGILPITEGLPRNALL